MKGNYRNQQVRDYTYLRHKQNRDKGDPKKMNKQATTTIMTRLRWGAFFLVLLFLFIQVIPPRTWAARRQQEIFGC